jgi:hypothetical protein
VVNRPHPRIRSPEVSPAIAEILEKAAKLIEPEGAWTQGHFARGASGNPTGVNSRWARSFCAEGAILFSPEGLTTSEQNDADDFFCSILPDAPGNPIAAWNDAPERTQAEVVAKLRQAAAIARGEQSC